MFAFIFLKLRATLSSKHMDEGLEVFFVEEIGGGEVDKHCKDNDQ